MRMQHLLLVNPTITSRRHARFPLSLLALAGALEGRATCRVIDGNVDRGYLASIRAAMGQQAFDAVGVTVMGGPQVQAAIQASRAARDASPSTPIVWGGYFPTLYPATALNAPYVDYAVRGSGEAAIEELLAFLRTTQMRADGALADLHAIRGLSWKRGGAVVHNVDRAFADQRAPALLPYDLLGDPRRYLARTFLGARTAVHQVAVGCRFRCTFCGVAAMFRGATALSPAARLQRDLTWLRDRVGADSIQYFDHNFFDREADMIPILEAMARVPLPWWCYARADALMNLSASSWALVRKSRLRMAYIGAESPNDALLKSIRKGTRSDQTLAVADLCRRHGVIPELSFMVAPPVDPEGETERTFEFIREVKRVNPHAEIIVYIYTPLPLDLLSGSGRAHAASIAPVDAEGRPLIFPASPEEWTAKRWVDYACHADAPWVSESLRERIRN
ncbi:MAG TPA: cobalamin-dependent protein, partial [Steroidobacteraceae bacterium]|nr:cobalamin-dependent protein [Steroidobacteraceae bacterium]